MALRTERRRSGHNAHGTGRYARIFAHAHHAQQFSHLFFKTGCSRKASASVGYVYVEVCARPLTLDLRLRNQRRFAGMLSTIPTMLLSAAGSGAYFLTLEIDPSKMIAGVRRL